MSGWAYFGPPFFVSLSRRHVDLLALSFLPVMSKSSFVCLL